MNAKSDSTPAPLAAAVVTMLTTHALVIVASMALPVLAPIAAETLGVPARYVGLYVSILYFGAALSSLIAPNLVARYGAVRTSQGTLVCAAAGLLALASGTVALAVVSALFIGFAYGPGNTASGQLLTAMTAEGRRSGVFSIKQTSVPLGAGLCGLVMPPLALLLGWQMATVAAALVCLALALLVQPWRGRLDFEYDPQHRLLPKNPVAPVLTVLRGPRLRALGLTGLTYAGMQFAFGAIMVSFLVERARISAVEAGLVLSAAMATSFFARLLWGYVADRTQPHGVLGGLGFLTAGSVVTAVFVGPGWPQIALLALGCWFGAAGYSWNGVFLALVADIAGPARVSDATSGAMTLVFIGSLAFPGVFTGLVAAFGYEAALLCVAAATALAGVYVLVKLSRSPAAR